MTGALLSQFWIQELGWTLLHFLWQGTAIAAIYAALRVVLRRSLSPQGRYALACFALTAMTFAPALTFFLTSRGNVLPGSLTRLPWSISASMWQRLLPASVVVWLAGVLSFCIRMLGGWRFTTHLRKASHPAPPEWQRTLEQIAVRIRSSRPTRLLLSSLVEVPTVIGWLRPVILLPVGALTGLPLEHVAALLAHELAHIRRHDYLANILQSMVEAVLFYHPAVWWVSAQIRAERELCCDDLAVAASGDVLTYARALAQLESIQPPRLRTALAANGGSLVNRVRRLIEPSQPAPDNLPGAGAAWAMALLLLTGAGVATVHAAQQPETIHTLAATTPAPARPSPFGEPPSPANALAGHVRNTLFFDPFLSAQLTPPAKPRSPEPDAAPRFEVADVHNSPRGAIPYMKGGTYRGGRYEVHSAEMLDLIWIAYGVDFEKVVGGPNWLESDRFDVIAKAGADATPATVRLMLRNLLAERFNLVAREDKRDEPTYALTAGPKLQLREADGSGDTGCKFDAQNSAAGRGGPAANEPVAIPTYTVSYTCRNMTMPAFAEQIRTMIGRNPNPLLDETGLKGSWDFNFKYSFQGVNRNGPLFDAIDRQLGLKLEPRMAPVPVIVVENVNRKPPDNPPGVADKLPHAPTEFEVADIRPSDPDSNRRGTQFQPGGRAVLRGATLKNLIVMAFDSTPAEVVGGAKFVDTDRFDIIAQAPVAATSESPAGESPMDMDAFRAMLRTMLKDRFKLATHTEDRPVPAYALVAVKPNLTKADPANRTAFHERPASDSKDPRIVNPAITRLVTFRNVTMAQFAEDLPIMASGYFQGVSRNVLDATGIDGAWDFTLSFSAAGVVPAEGSDPYGGISLFEAMERQLGIRLELQKRPLPVLVIDHVEQKPTDN